MEETTEIYFIRLERLIARENFLEKESLNATVHHLEYRTGFFDKLAVLAAGSLAVGISFMTAGFQRESLQHLIHQHLFLLTVALSCILLSLITCVLHNFMTSWAVHLLSKQLESLSQGAHEKVRAYEMQPFPNEAVRTALATHSRESEQVKLKRAKWIQATMITGLIAVAFFVIGYLMGFVAVVLIFAIPK